MSALHCSDAYTTFLLGWNYHDLLRHRMLFETCKVMEINIQIFSAPDAAAIKIA